MAKVIVYNVYTQALETFYLEENDPMPYAYDRTMLVREFRGSSRSSVLWTTNAAMEAWNATRRTYGAPIPFRYAFKRIWEGGHGKQSQHYAGVSFDVGQALTQAERNRIWNTANNLGVWVYLHDTDLGTPRQTVWHTGLQCRIPCFTQWQPWCLRFDSTGCIKRIRLQYTDP